MSTYNEIGDLARDLFYQQALISDYSKREVMWSLCQRADEFIKTARYLHGLGYRLIKEDHKNGDWATNCDFFKHNLCNHGGTRNLCVGKGNPDKYHQFIYNNSGVGICRYCIAQTKCEHEFIDTSGFSICKMCKKISICNHKYMNSIIPGFNKCLNCGYVEQV